jgi:hypothetical protein
MCACLAPDQYSEMLQPNPNLAWILNDTHIRCRHRFDTRFEKRATSSAMVTNRKRWN